MDLKIKFAERFNALIVNNLTSISQVAAELDINEPNLSRYGGAQAMPTLKNTVAIANYFGVTTDYLLGLAAENSADKFRTCPPFHERFKEVLNGFSVTRYKLQKGTGIAESVMRYWAQGKTDPSVSNVIKIANFLNCTIDFLLGREY